VSCKPPQDHCYYRRGELERSPRHPSRNRGLLLREGKGGEGKGKGGWYRKGGEGTGGKGQERRKGKRRGREGKGNEGRGREGKKTPHECGLATDLFGVVIRRL